MARGGSKRIPRKNIKYFHGYPVIKYSIDAALNTGCFNEVMVSTDDQQIAEISSSFGAKVPFMRSETTAGDFSTTSDVILEVLREYGNYNLIFTHCCCMYAAAPFITSEKLDSAYNKLISTGADVVMPVVRYSYPIQRSLKIENGLIKMNSPEFINTRSQDLTPTYHDCGQFYFLKIEPFIHSNKLFTEFTIPLIMSELEVQDIDTEEDWNIAELKYSLLKQRTGINS